MLLSAPEDAWSSRFLRQDRDPDGIDVSPAAHRRVAQQAPDDRFPESTAMCDTGDDQRSSTTVSSSTRSWPASYSRTGSRSQARQSMIQVSEGQHARASEE